MREVSKNIFEALGVSDTTPEQDQKVTETITKLLFKPDYYKSDLIIETLEILGIPVTEETKKASGIMFLAGQSVQSIEDKMSLLTKT